MFVVTDSAAEFYRNEMELRNGDCLRLFVRYAGSGDSGGFSLGVMSDRPSYDDYKQEVGGVTYFVRPDDQWFVDRMKLDYDESCGGVLCDLPSMA
ncbi:iron-sulfur cluster biosynthesis family protein [Pseudalkalibacillus hwajinpoensis]|uniref:HesB/YadR/YfhF family protein n=1 Tax=Guptibacillus hwajinpoensis TaxID=208199 RepID=UPI00325BF2F4